MPSSLLREPVATDALSSNAPYSAWTTSALLDQLLGQHSRQAVHCKTLPELFDQANNADPCVRKCLVARELVRRWLLTELERGALFTSPQTVRDYLMDHFAGYEQESFVVLFLDAQHRLIRAEEMFRGTLNQTSVYPREVVKAALKSNCAAVVFAHNHPSGATEPSRADKVLTQALKAALGLIDVRVLDHFVIGDGHVLSFAEQQLL